MSIDVFLRKEKVGNLQESNLFDFRLLCEQVGYRTDVLKNGLYVRPWLEGKRLVIDLRDGENETDSLRSLRDCAGRLPFLDMMQSILSAYGMETYILPQPHFPSKMDQRSRMANQAGGDLYLLMQASPMVNKNRIHLWYGYSSLKQSKSLADCLYASLHALEQARVQKPSLLWKPWSSQRYNSLLKEINMPGVVIEYLYANEDGNDDWNVRQIASALCQGILAYFQVPVLSPSIHQPEIWELVAKYVLKIPLAENGTSQGEQHFPHEKEYGEDKNQMPPVPEPEIFDQEALPSLHMKEQEQNSTEKSELWQIEMDLIPERFEENEPSETDIAAEFLDNKEGELSPAQEEEFDEEPEADDERRVLTLLSSLSEEDHGLKAADSSKDSPEESDPGPVALQDIPQSRQQHSSLPVEQPEVNPTEISEHRQMDMIPKPERFEANEPSETAITPDSFRDKEEELSPAHEERSAEKPEADDESRVLTPLSSLSKEEHGLTAADSSEDSQKESNPGPVPSQDNLQPKQQQPAPASSTKAQRPQKTDPADPWEKMASLPHWNQSSLMRPNQPNPHRQLEASQTGPRAPRDAQVLSQHSFPADAAEINPFARKKAPSSTVDPFKKQQPNR